MTFVALSRSESKPMHCFALRRGGAEKFKLRNLRNTVSRPVRVVVGCPARSIRSAKADDGAATDYLRVAKHQHVFRYCYRYIERLLIHLGCKKREWLGHTFKPKDYAKPPGGVSVAGRNNPLISDLRRQRSFWINFQKFIQRNVSWQCLHSTRLRNIADLVDPQNIFPTNFCLFHI